MYLRYEASILCYASPAEVWGIVSDAVSPFAVESDNPQSSTGQSRHHVYGLGRGLLCGQGLHCVASRFGNDQSHRYLSNTRCGGRSYPVVSVQSGSKDRAVADSARKFQRDSACGIRGGEVSILIHRERSNGISEHV